MNVEYNDFIGVYSNVCPDGYCKFLVDKFEEVTSYGAGSDRMKFEGTHRHVKDDVMFNTVGHNFGKFNDIRSQDIFFEHLQYCFEEYTSKFSILSDLKLFTKNMKMQRTDSGQGYHVWHAEHGGSAEASSRVLVFMLYLNTLGRDEGGETEFLYQKKRYHPVENTMLFWPAAYTHAHRGNTVLGINSKYIVTGWFNLT